MKLNPSRRHFLQGISLGTGAAVLSPVLQQVAAHAAGATPGKRFVFVVEGNGLPWQQIQPVGLARAKEGERAKLVNVGLGDHEIGRAHV